MKPIPKPMYFSVEFLCVVLVVGCASYPEEVHKALKTGFGHDFPSYTFRGSPVGNFGVGTIYEDRLLDGREQPQETWLLANPNTWYADDVTDQQRKDLDRKIFEKGPMGSAALKTTVSSSLGISACIPNIAEVLNAGVTVDYKKGVKVTLKASNAVNRQMNWSEFVHAVDGGKMQPYIRELLTNYHILIVSHDIILEGYSVKVDVDESVNQELNIGLNEATKKTVSGDLEFGVKVTKKGQGVFEVTAANPVVVAVSFRCPPKPELPPRKVLRRLADLGLPEEGIREMWRSPRPVFRERLAPDWDEKRNAEWDLIRRTYLRPPASLDKWETVVIPNRTLDPIEKLLADKGLPEAKK